MSFHKFTILSTTGRGHHEDTEQTILFNLEHIVSVKPINIVVNGKVKPGYWIRTTNGKKYRAVRIPEILMKALGKDSKPRSKNPQFDEDDDQVSVNEGSWSTLQ